MKKRKKLPTQRTKRFSNHVFDAYIRQISKCNIHVRNILFPVPSIIRHRCCERFCVDADVVGVRVTRFHRVLVHCTRRFLYKVIVPWHWIRKHLLFFHLLAKKYLHFRTSPCRTLAPPECVECVRIRLKWEGTKETATKTKQISVFSAICRRWHHFPYLHREPVSMPSTSS